MERAVGHLGSADFNRLGTLAQGLLQATSQGR